MHALTDRKAASVTEERRDNCRGRSRTDGGRAEQKVTVMSGDVKTAGKKAATPSAINSQIVMLCSSAQEL